MAFPFSQESQKIMPDDFLKFRIFELVGTDLFKGEGSAVRQETED